MRGVFTYNDPQRRALAVRLVNVEGKSWDVAAGAWADDPAQALIPMGPVKAADANTWQIAELPELKQADAPVVAFPHLQAGGPPVDGPQQILFPAVGGNLVYGFGFFT